MKTLSKVAFLVLSYFFLQATVVRSEIVENGIWTGYDYSILDYFLDNDDNLFEFPYTVTNGVPDFIFSYMVDPARIQHVGANDDIYAVRSVQRVQ